MGTKKEKSSQARMTSLTAVLAGYSAILAGSSPAFPPKTQITQTSWEALCWTIGGLRTGDSSGGSFVQRAQTEVEENSSWSAGSEARCGLGEGLKTTIKKIHT